MNLTIMYDSIVIFRGEVNNLEIENFEKKFMLYFTYKNIKYELTFDKDDEHELSIDYFTGAKWLIKKDLLNY